MGDVVLLVGWEAIPHIFVVPWPIPKSWPNIAYPDALVNPLNDSKHWGCCATATGAALR